MHARLLAVATAALVAASHLAAAPAPPPKASEADAGKAFDGLKLRAIGPALNSGRIADIAIHPTTTSTMYVAVGSGGVWKTVNAGTTWTPIFDKESSYRIGCVAIDPSARTSSGWARARTWAADTSASVTAIYQSTDGGRDVAEHGPRGLAAPVDHHRASRELGRGVGGRPGSALDRAATGGCTRRRTAARRGRRCSGAGEWTGVTDIVIDPRNPDRLYAATWDRHRTVAAYMGGGPESGIWKLEDGGETWKQLKTGLPEGPLGKIGLAISPQKPDIVYAAIETIRRTDGGLPLGRPRRVVARRCPTTVSGGTGPHYYQELYACPHASSGGSSSWTSGIRVSDDGCDDLPPAQQRRQARRRSRHRVPQGRPGLHHRRVRRGPVRELRRREDLAVHGQPAGDAVLQDRRGRLRARSTTCTAAPRTTAPRRADRAPTRPRDPNSDWFTTLGADGQDQAVEPGNPNIHLRRVPAGRHVAHRPDHGRGGVHPAPGPARASPIERFNWDAPIEVSFHQPTRIFYRVVPGVAKRQPGRQLDAHLR